MFAISTKVLLQYYVTCYSDNRLVYVEDDEELIKPAFQNIRSLILNAMGMTWDEVGYGSTILISLNCSN